MTSLNWKHVFKWRITLEKLEFEQQRAPEYQKCFNSTQILNFYCYSFLIISLFRLRRFWKFNLLIFLNDYRCQWRSALFHSICDFLVQTPLPQPTPEWSKTAEQGSCPTSSNAAPTMKPALPTGSTWSGSSRTVWTSLNCNPVFWEGDIPLLPQLPDTPARAIQSLLIAHELQIKWARSPI